MRVAWCRCLAVVILSAMLAPAPASAQAPLKPTGGAHRLTPFLTPYVRITNDSLSQHQPDVVYNNADQEFVVVWSQARSAADTDRGIFAQRLDRWGAPEGGIVTVRSMPGSRYTQPRIAYNSLNNEYLLVWTFEYSTSDFDLYGMVLDSSLLPLTDVLTIEIEFTSQSNPGVAYNSVRREYAVVYQSERTAGQGKYEILGRRITLSGTVSPTVTIASDAGWSFSEPAFAHNPIRDQYSVAYTAVQNGQTVRWVREKTASGLLVPVLGSEWTLDYPESQQATVADANNDHYLMAWSQIDNSMGVIRGFEGAQHGMVMVYDVSDPPEPFRRYHPRAAYFPSRRYFVVWEEADTAGTTGSDVYGTFILRSSSSNRERFAIDATDFDQLSPAVACAPQGPCIVAEEDNFYRGFTGGTSEISVYFVRLDETYVPAIRKNSAP
jgi:hypothetical protein